MNFEVRSSLLQSLSMNPLLSPLKFMSSLLSSFQSRSPLLSPLQFMRSLLSSFQSRSPLLSPLQFLLRWQLQQASTSAPLWVVKPTPELSACPFHSQGGRSWTLYLSSHSRGSISELSLGSSVLSALLWWSSALPWRSSVLSALLWWSSAPSWAPSLPAPAWLFALPTLLWFSGLTLAPGPLLPHGPGPPSLLLIMEHLESTP